MLRRPLYQRQHEPTFCGFSDSRPFGNEPTQATRRIGPPSIPPGQVCGCAKHRSAHLRDSVPPEKNLTHLQQVLLSKVSSQISYPARRNLSPRLLGSPIVEASSLRRALKATGNSWQIQTAKARFSEVFRL